ncbi:Spt20 family-domain-containing protein [Naematelia encephala]|uniref:Spt20 family-domain-containing protein n=1 Tax=Naematelia encephala TaxID=71784 RepID=A0A1Y2AVU1_9TREE|nr:Spt20 family-domain-containing protein [Naematelia encephala]
MASASGYNHHRFARAVLKKSRKWEPSLTVQLYASYWRFENSQMPFQYDGPMRPFLLALRAQVIPASLIPFLYDIRPYLSFVDGCLVVEIQDFRKMPEARSRVVMRPAAEALIGTMGVLLARKNITDEGTALELESRIIAATSPPLYLGSSILATRNAALAVTLTTPAPPNLAADGSFRHPTASTTDERSDAERMRKLLAIGPQRSGTFQPNWSILRLQERIANHHRMKERAQLAPGGPQAQPDGTANGAATGGEGEKKKSKKKRPAPDDTDEKKTGKKKKTDGAEGEVKKKKPAAKDGEVKKKKKPKVEEAS